MSRTSTALVLLAASTIGLTGCFTPRVNVNVDKNAVRDVKQIVSSVTGDDEPANGRSRRR